VAFAQRVGAPRPEVIKKGVFANPINVRVVQAPVVSDIYEPNNTQAQAAVIPFAITGNNLDANTDGSNFHNDADVDYYQLNLEAGYQYNIRPFVLDFINQSSNSYYTAHVLYAYSVDGGTTWTQIFDVLSTVSFTVNGGRSILFRTQQYFVGQKGTYKLFMPTIRRRTLDVAGTENFTLSVYPNPATETLHVKIDNASADAARVDIIDALGKVLHTESLSLTTGNTVQGISIGTLSKGMYQARVTIGEKQYLNSFVKE
jgi:hypothetical protein